MGIDYCIGEEEYVVAEVRIVNSCFFERRRDNKLESI